MCDFIDECDDYEPRCGQIDTSSEELEPRCYVPLMGETEPVADVLCNVGLACEDCGDPFERATDYLNQKRSDPMFKWKNKKCDSCVDKRVNKAFERMPEILKSLAG